MGLSSGSVPSRVSAEVKARAVGLGGFADTLSDEVERINEFGAVAGFGEIPTGIDAC